MGAPGRIGAAVKASIWILVFALLCSSLIGGIAQADRVLPNAILYYNTEGPLLFDEIIRAVPKVPALEVNAQSSSIVSVRSAWNDLYYTDVRAVRTDENFPKFHDITMISGAFFRPEDGGYENMVVISDKLANEIFLTVDAAGLELQIGSTYCKVAGVYKTDDSLTARYASDGYDVVYVPYYIYDGVGDNTVQMLYMRNTPGYATEAEVPEEPVMDEETGEPVEAASEPEAERESIRFTQMMEWNDATGGKTTVYYQPLDLYSVQHLLWQSIRVLVFLCGAILMAHGIGYLAGESVAFYEFYVDAKHRHAIIPPSVWLREAAPSAITLVLLLTLLFLILFEPYYPPGFLPSNGHLFDFEHYIRIIMEASQRRNLESGYFYYDNYAFTTLWLNAAYLIGCTVSFGCACSAVKRAIRRFRGE